jgi:methylphosphotriester-DNA--protein-cysteine methyltransferase
VTIIVRRPAPPLAGLVTGIVYQAGEQPRTSVQKILPDAEPSLWVNLNRDEFRSLGGPGPSRVPGAMLAGPRSRALVTEFEAGRAHIWVSFALGAAPAFFPVPLASTADELVPLAELWGRCGGSLRDRLLSAASPQDMLRVMEQILMGQLAAAGADLAGADLAVCAAARALSSGQAVGQVADGLGLLPRTLRRRFTARAGLTPKRFARVQRLRRVTRSLDGQARADWAAVAAQHGYCDQAHLIDEFQDLADITPGDYLRSRADGPNHVRV